MRDLPIVTVNIHGSPRVAHFDRNSSSVSISTDAEYAMGSRASFFCQDRDLAQKLAVAINAIIEAHAADLAQRTNIQEAAE